MNLLILSDLHFEFHKDSGVEFINALPDGDAVDCVALAGDICGLMQLPHILRLFCDRYANVVYLWGNHECYGHSIGAVRECALGLQEKLLNLHVLDNTRLPLSSVATFIGAPLWFPDQKDNAKHEYWLNDFHDIENFKNEVYLENDKSMEFLSRMTQPRDIVITHHLPSSMSIAEEYEGSDLNRFFLCDMESTMKEKQPKLWIHGHTHSSADYTIFRTQVVCNPFGYPHQPNPAWHPLIISV